ncbi:H/ACA ribonucleoprotein complex subunit [Trichinella pseudospiralis]
MGREKKHLKEETVGVSETEKIPAAYQVLLDKARKFKREGVLTGIDQVQKAIRKGKIGICVLAGDVSPIDYYSHIPIVCEEKNLAYIFLPSKNHIGAAVQSSRPVMIAYILCCESYKDLYNEVQKIIEALPMPNE